LWVDLETGLLQGARHVASPNCDARPEGVEADLIVVHGISLPPGEFGGPWIERLFTNSLPADMHPYFDEVGSLRVSSHLVVMRDGAVTQYVKFTERAWHAVELEGTDTLPYEAAQYDALARVVAALSSAYPRLSADRIVGHSDIAPGRKTDPGQAFDWPRAHRLIAAAPAPPRYGKT
jgi:AmpD protein